MVDPTGGLGGPPIVDPTPEPFLGRVDELDAGPLVSSSSSASASTSSSSLPIVGMGNSDPTPGLAQDPHRLRADGSGTNGGGGVLQHGLSERPRAISSTTDLSGYRDAHEKSESENENENESEGGMVGEGDMETEGESDVSSTSTKSLQKRRTIRRLPLPRTVSTQSLTDRFVSTGMEVMDPAKEERARLGGTPGEGSGAVVVNASGGKEGDAEGGPDEGHGIKVERDVVVDNEEIKGEKQQELRKQGSVKKETDENSAPLSKVRKVEQE